MTTRRATHAGSWYTSSRSKLDAELTGWLAAVDRQDPVFGGADLPISGCKAIIAPHAGYSYSGPAAAWAYRCVDVENIKRVFVIGPSHHAYLDGCALPVLEKYETPLGGLELDLETIDKLRKTGKFHEMTKEMDETEHSIEMHLPYIRKIFGSRPITLVPILVGSISHAKETSFGILLAPYLSDATTLFVISSDFCHWGTRFSYTAYQPLPTSPSPQLRHLTRSKSAMDEGHPIHAAIEQLDKAGMSCIAYAPPKTPSQSHDQFSAYLKETKNTICGRHPIGVLLATLKAMRGEGSLEWVRYEQSSAVEDESDSSVSYASAYVRMG